MLAITSRRDERHRQEIEAGTVGFDIRGFMPEEYTMRGFGRRTATFIVA